MREWIHRNSSRPQNEIRRNVALNDLIRRYISVFISYVVFCDLLYSYEWGRELYGEIEKTSQMWIRTVHL